MEQELFTGLEPEERHQMLIDNCDCCEKKAYNKLLTEEQLNELKNELAETSIELENVTEEKRIAMFRMKQRIDKINGIKADLLESLRKKTTEVWEDCYKFTDIEKNEVGYYNEEGMLVWSRDATIDEKQLKIELKVEAGAETKIDIIGDFLKDDKRQPISKIVEIIDVVCNEC